MRKVLKAFVIVLLVGIMVFSVFMIIKTMWEYTEADEIYENLQSEFVETKLEENTDADNTEDSGEPTEAVPISVDFASLSEQNSDIVGWLYGPDTPVNYPVVQGKDNNQYLRANLNDKYLVSGTVFVDYRNGAVGEDANYIVYGHNMKNGTMFGPLVKYKEQSYYDEHPVLYYLTPDGDYKIELYAGLVVKRDSVIYSPNPAESEFAEFLLYAKEHSTFHSDVEITKDDTLITLSTCSYEYNNARYIVIGKLKSFAVFALPIFILLTHWFCIFCTSRDPKNKNQSKKVFGMVLWICPITSLVANGMIYATAFGKAIDMNFLVYLLTGLLFVIIGNYLPKCKQNYTIGIRVKWALENEKNWNATHRFSGKVWAIGGVLMMGCSFLPEEISMYVFMALIIVLSILSIGYSYYYFKVRQQ